eukprot:765272-Hanusia_phi.AAC.7
MKEGRERAKKHDLRVKNGETGRRGGGERTRLGLPKEVRREGEERRGKREKGARIQGKTRGQGLRLGLRETRGERRGKETMIGKLRRRREVWQGSEDYGQVTERQGKGREE